MTVTCNSTTYKEGIVAFPRQWLRENVTILRYTYSAYLVYCLLFINLEFVSPYIIIYSNESTNQMHLSLRFIACRINTAQHVSGILMPVIGSLLTAVATSGLRLERGGSSAVGRGRSDRTDNDQQHCYQHVPTVNQKRLLQLIGSR